MNMLKLGTRGSKLALWQANWVATELRQLGHDVKIVVIKTSGDAVQSDSIATVGLRSGTQGVFTREIQHTLLAGDVDVAVHSLKDLPTEPVDGLVLSSVPKRGPHRDAFLARRAKSLEELPENSRIGTGSLRRKTQILNRFGNRFRIDDIRGNVGTRLRKLDDGQADTQYDALILAEAGLARLGFADRIDSLLEPPDFFPAVGQGALGLEIRADDRRIGQILAPLSDPATFAAVIAERALLHTLQGGCIAPIAALGQVKQGKLTLHGRVLSMDGSKKYDAEMSIPADGDAARLGIDLAHSLLDAGADAVLDEIKGVRQTCSDLRKI